MPIPSLTQITIDLDHLQWNYRRLAALAGEGTALLPMVKADAYGHGLVSCARALAACGAGVFGVAEADEGRRLRRAGIRGDIVVFLGTTQYDALIDFDLSPVVFDGASLTAISERAVARGVTVGVHVKVDVGMGRLGVAVDETPALIGMIDRLPGVRLAGVLAHFPRADDAAFRAATLAENDLFLQTAAGARDHGAVLHIANSAGLRYPEARLDLARPGITLYGCAPAPEDPWWRGLDLRPVMSFKTRVLQVKEVPAGTGISYGHTFVTSRPSRLAVLPVGYANGYLRALSNRAEVLIGGRRMPVRGRVCMNATIVEVTAAGAVAPGDEVVLLGRQEGEDGADTITADEIAAWMGTISYEVLCLLGNANERHYTGGQGISSSDLQTGL